MSVNFFADPIAATSNHSKTHSHSTMFASGQEENSNNYRNKTVETENALMEKRYRYQHQYQQGSTGLGTPDANTYASSMSSNSINNNNNQEQQQFASSSSITSASTCGLNVQDLFSQLHEALALEPKYQPNLFLPQQSNVSVLYKHH